jgi:hypothetical protein
MGLMKPDDAGGGSDKNQAGEQSEEAPGLPRPGLRSCV